jgi:hypothetical protein
LDSASCLDSAGAYPAYGHGILCSDSVSGEFKSWDNFNCADDPLSVLRAVLLVLQQVGNKWREMCRSAAGAALLDTWGYASEAEEIEETVMRLAAAYTDSDGDF